MKKILIIEDNQIVANVYRNKLAVEGYQAEIALDGETGLNLMRSFKPDIMVLDLILPKMSGVDVIKQIRGEADFANLPIIVFSNTYLTNLIQDAWKAGANKCLSKASCSPKEILDIVRHTIGESGVLPKSRTPAEEPAEKNVKAERTAAGGPQDTVFQSNVQQSFLDSLPATLAALRSGLQNLVKADNEAAQLNLIHELHDRVHDLTRNAGIANLTLISKMSDAVEALLKELHEKPKNINASTLRTVAAAVDFLGALFERGYVPEKEGPPARALIVDDEEIAVKAVAYALEKARLKSFGVNDPIRALDMLLENKFDLVVLDVGMPNMDGFEFCSKLRTLANYRKTPVVFVTSLNDFETRANSTMSGGNDFIAKPFLFIELATKAVVHVLRARLEAAKN